VNMLKVMTIGLAAESQRLRRLETKEKNNTLMEDSLSMESDEFAKKYGHLTMVQYARLHRRRRHALSATHRASLHKQRTHTVRKQSRCTALAVGFFKGHAYTVLEAFCYEQPKWDVVQKLVEDNIHEGRDVREVMQTFSEWMDSAKHHYLACHPELNNQTASRAVHCHA
jgi:hypothetical protein